MNYITVILQWEDDLEVCKSIIEKKVNDIFVKRFSIDLLHNPEMRGIKLLGKSKISASEFLYIYYDVKKIFGISIPEDDIVNSRFDIFDNIVEIIYKQKLISNE